jgi:hypothetical protein
MKNVRILGLATMLAVGMTLSAQAQSQNTTGSETTSTPDSTMSMQQSESTASSMSTNSGDVSKYSTTISKDNKITPQAQIDWLTQLQNESGAM